MPHLASRPRYKKKKNTQIYRKQTLPFSRPPAHQYPPELGYRGGSGLSDLQGEGPVKHRPPMRNPHVAVAARKWPFTPVLRAHWNALRSTGLSTPHAADCSPALSRTQFGSHYPPHTKWQQWGSTRDARGPPGGKSVHLARAQGYQQQPRRQITPDRVSGYTPEGNPDGQGVCPTRNRCTVHRL